MATLAAIPLQLAQLDALSLATPAIHGLASLLSADIILCSYYLSLRPLISSPGMVECLMHPKKEELVDLEEEEEEEEEEEDYEEGEEESEEGEGPGGDEEEEGDEGDDGPPAKRQKRDDDDKKKKKDDDGGEEGEEEGEEEEEVRLRCQGANDRRRARKRKRSSQNLKRYEFN